MVDVKELRKGNYVRYIDDKTICELSINGIHQIDMGTHKAEPIPLTESIISKTNINGGLAVHNSNFSGFLKLQWSMLNTWELWIGGVCLKTVTYLHELQNIIYFLTDEELEL